MQPQGKGGSISTNYLHRFYEAFLSGLSGDLTTLVSIIVSSESIFTTALPDVLSLMPRMVQAIRRLIPTPEQAPIRRAINMDDLRRACYKILGSIFVVSAEKKAIIELTVGSLLVERNAGNGRYLLNQLACYSLQHPIVGIDRVIVDCLPNWPADVQLTACAGLSLANCSMECAGKLIAYVGAMLSGLSHANHRIIIAITECLLQWYLAGRVPLLPFVSFLVRATQLRKHSASALITPLSDDRSERTLRFFPSTPKVASEASGAAEQQLMPAVEAKVKSVAQATLMRMLYLDHFDSPAYPLRVDSPEADVGERVFLLNNSLISCIQRDTALLWIVRAAGGRVSYEHSLVTSTEQSADNGPSVAVKRHVKRKGFQFSNRFSTGSVPSATIHNLQIIDEWPRQAVDLDWIKVEDAKQKYELPLSNPPKHPQSLPLHRLLLAHLTIPTLGLPIDDGLKASIASLDALPTREQVTVPVFFGQSGRTLLDAFLAPACSPSFLAFFRSLGYPVGELLYYSNELYEMRFIANMLPSAEDSSIASIVWLEDEDDLLNLPSTLPGSVVYLVVRPLCNSFFQVRIIVSLGSLPDSIVLVSVATVS